MFSFPAYKCTSTTILVGYYQFDHFKYQPYSLLAGKLCMFLSSSDLFQNHFFLKKKTFRKTISLDPDQARRAVGPEQGPNYLKM